MLNYFSPRNYIFHYCAVVVVGVLVLDGDDDVSDVNDVDDDGDDDHILVIVIFFIVYNNIFLFLILK